MHLKRNRSYIGTRKNEESKSVKNNTAENQRICNKGKQQPDRAITKKENMGSNDYAVNELAKQKLFTSHGQTLEVTNQEYHSYGSNKDELLIKNAHHQFEEEN